MPITTSDTPLQKFRFRVTLGNGASAGFQKVSGLKREIELVEYNESNSNRTKKLRGREKLPEVTLERGMYADTSMESLYKKSLTEAKGQNVLIELLDADGNTARRWQLTNAWASTWEAGDLDAGSSDIAIEKVVLQYEDIIS